MHPAAHISITPAHDAALRASEERVRESARFHMGQGNVHETLKSLANDLGNAGIDYAILGGMALNAHGYARETVDVDVLVRPEGLAAFRERFVGRGYIETFSGARKTFRNTRTNINVEFITSGEYPGDGKPKPIAFPDPAAVATDVGGARYVTLPTLINLKLASGMTQPGRRRDLADVQDLIRILGLTAGFADLLNEYVRPMYKQLLGELETP